MHSVQASGLIDELDLFEPEDSTFTKIIPKDLTITVAASAGPALPVRASQSAAVAATQPGPDGSGPTAEGTPAAAGAAGAAPPPPLPVRTAVVSRRADGRLQRGSSTNSGDGDGEGGVSTVGTTKKKVRDGPRMRPPSEVVRGWVMAFWLFVCVVLWFV